MSARCEAVEKRLLFIDRTTDVQAALHTTKASYLANNFMKGFACRTLADQIVEPARQVLSVKDG